MARGKNKRRSHLANMLMKPDEPPSSSICSQCGCSCSVNSDAAQSSLPRSSSESEAESESSLPRSSNSETSNMLIQDTSTLTQTSKKQNKQTNTNDLEDVFCGMRRENRNMSNEIQRLLRRVKTVEKDVCFRKSSLFSF